MVFDVRVCNLLHGPAQIPVGSALLEVVLQLLSVEVLLCPLAVLSPSIHFLSVCDSIVSGCRYIRSFTAQL